MFVILHMIISRLVLTIIIELILGIFLGVKAKRDLLNIVLVNVLTNPVVVLIPFVIKIATSVFVGNVCFYLFEIITVFIEGLIYNKYLEYKKLNPYLFSFVLNLTTFIVGLMINYYL